MSVPHVRSYDDGSRLDGEPSPALVRASDSAGPTGVVSAYRDEAGVWQYVAPQDEDFYRRHRHHDVITVYVAR